MKKIIKSFLLIVFVLVFFYHYSLAKKSKTLSLEEIDIVPSYEEGLSFLNNFQIKLGNRAAVLDKYLLNAAKNHAIYLSKHFYNKEVSLKWHSQDPKKEGFFGKTPTDQVKAFGYKTEKDFIVINTTTGWTSENYAEPKYLIEHFTGTIFHRWLTIAPEINKVGFYKLVSKDEFKRYLLVAFFSVKLYPEKPVGLFYPFENQKNVPTAMLPELPTPFPNDTTVGYPITFQYFSKKTKWIPVLRRVWLKGPGNRYIPVYRITPRSAGQAGKLARSFKLIGIVSKDPLLNNTEYTVYMKISNQYGKIIFNKRWKFTTEKATVPVIYSF